MMEQTAYIAYLKQALRKERKRSEVQQTVNFILTVATLTLLCMLAIMSNAA